MASATDVDVIREAIKGALADLHTCLPGQIVVYNPAKQTATVAPVIKRQMKKADGSKAHELIPPIHNVPVLFPRGGGTSILWPLVTGDGVLLVFSEAATAQWRSTGQISEPGDTRRHELSYAFAIPGVAPTTNPVTPPNVGNEILVTPSTHMRVGGLTADFVSLDQLVQACVNYAIANHVHSTGMGPSGNGVLAGALPSTAASKLKSE